jgi:hypothetical protein
MVRAHKRRKIALSLKYDAKGAAWQQKSGGRKKRLTL